MDTQAQPMIALVVTNHSTGTSFVEKLTADRIPARLDWYAQRNANSADLMNGENLFSVVINNPMLRAYFGSI